MVYNLTVARELLKQVYVAERLQPPTDLAVVRSAYSTLWSRASNPAYWRGILNSGEWTKVGIYALEAYGIFKVRLTLSMASQSLTYQQIGEILGRRSLVGYNIH